MSAAVEIGRRIREAREAAGMSQGALAKALRMRQGPVSNIENGKNCPSADTLLRLCAALGATPDALLLGADAASVRAAAHAAARAKASMLSQSLAAERAAHAQTLRLLAEARRTLAQIARLANG